MKLFKVILFTTGTFLAISVSAQDTTKRKTIEITSSFKPVLREAAKINFNAAPPAADNNRPVLQYKVPAQNLLFNYQPMPLQPVALQPDSAASWQNSNYIKLGVGSVIIPYIQTGFSFGDNKNSFYNIFADHYDAKGSLPFQKNNHTSVAATATYKTPKNLEWSGKLGFQSDQYFLYGYQPATLVFTKDQLRQQFQSFGGNLSLRNMTTTEYGINYNPNIKISVFSGKNDIHKASEANAVLNVPVQKTIGDYFTANLGFTADLTNYRPKDTATIQNNLFSITASVQYTKQGLHITGGLIPSWDNKKVSVLPDFMADITTKDQKFTIQLGWIGYYDKGSYERYASINPWIAQPTALLNTRVVERYVGIKGSVLNHLSYSAKLGFNTYKNMALFANDTIDGKTFVTLYTPSMNVLSFHGELGYTLGEHFSATGKLTLNEFSSVKDQAKAWGLLPLEFDALLRWKIMKDFWLRSDLNLWDGAAYRTLTKAVGKGDAAFDLSAGLEYKLTKSLNLWFQMNNIFNNKYERWHQYPVYGFNVLGGIVFSFNQK